MAQRRIDSLIVIAMSEEVKALEQSGFFALDDGDSFENFPFRTFRYPDKDGEERNGIVASPGEIGAQSREVAVLFSREFAPRIVLNIGISGRVKDCKVGDVVAPSQLNIIDARSALQDSKKGGYEMLPGGRTSQVSPNARFVLNTSTFSQDNGLHSLERYMREIGYRPSDAETKQIEAWQRDGSLARDPDVVVGTFASGSMVMKSGNFKKEVLHSIDRNIVAFDMESGAIADSLRALKDPPEFFAVRAISDPADDRKPAFDAIGDGLLRRWAVLNATTTLKTLLQTPALYGKRDMATDLASEDVKRDYLENYPGQALLTGSADDFDARFANLFLHEDTRAGPKVKFTQFVDDLSQKAPGDRILVQGHGGAGKSALLRKAWMSLREAGTCQAVFLNARNTLADSIMVGGRAALLRRIHRDAPDFEKNDQQLFVFVDELYGRNEEQELMEELETLLERMQPIYVFGFGVDHFDRAGLDGDDDPQDTYIYNMVFSRTYDLKIVGMEDEETALSIIDGILRTGGDAQQKTAEGVLGELRALGFLYVNHFVVSLYLDNIAKPRFNQAGNNATKYVLKAMEWLYGDLYKREHQREEFRNICVEALRAHCSQLAGSGPSERRAEFARRYETAYAVFPKVVQTALIAQAVVHILSQASTDADVFEELEIPREVFLSLVFANDVNSSIKDLMSVATVEEKVLAYADSIFRGLEPMGLSYALYLFGRARTAAGQREAKKMFVQARGLLSPSGKDVNYDKDDKYVRLARRSLHISAALAGDPVATTDYIRLVLSDPTEDSLNRSFHLEYYGDDRGTGITVKLDLEDTGGPWRHTRRTLRRRIEKAIQARMANDYDRICILTYFTLVRFRLEKCKLEDRAAEIEFLDQLMAANFQLGIELSSFLAGLRSQLEFEKFTHIDAIVELLKLKSVTRTGWNKRQMGSAGVEGVGAHVFGAMLLAELLLEHASPGISPDDRARVSRLLLTHDLGEAYIGDYDPTDGVAKAEELAAIQRLGSLSLFRTLQTAGEIPALFHSFETGTDPLARLAKDFDKLDAVFQGYIYAAQFPSVEDRTKFFNYHLDRIQSLELREMAQEVARRADAVTIVVN